MKLPLLLLSAVAPALFGGCARANHPAAAAPALPAVRVQAATVRLDTQPGLTEITGTVRPLRRATLAARLMGAIDEVPVTLGQPVRAGDVLVRISAAEISARLAQTQAQLDQANRDLARERDLLPKHASTLDLVQNLETRATLAAAAVREAKTMLGYAVIRAPFNGVVARKNVEAGDFASPGVPLIELEGTGDFLVVAGIPDSLAGGLKVGALVGISVPTAGISFSAPLAELSSTADAGPHTVTARFTVPAGLAVRSGQFARLQLPGSPVSALLVPASAVRRYGQMETLFVVGPDSRALLRLVKTGEIRGDQVEIVAGVDAGETVVVAPPAGLVEGRALEVHP